MFAASACERTASEEQGGAPPEPSALGDGLPSLELTDATPGLLLTWIDEQGDFHVGETIAEVPSEHRERVRVVVRDRSEGTGDLVYVADLRTKQGDRYRVDVLPRAEWEELGAQKRKVRLEQLAPGVKPASQVTAGDEAANGAVSAIVYGADWCQPCHEAERFLKSLGVHVTKKDIEASEAAQAEMQTKLARAGKRGASIPVIDVMGKLFVGYNPGALEHAVLAARKPQP